MSSDSPPDSSLIDALLNDIQPLLLLAWLDTQPCGQQILRGFQQTPRTLRLAPVRKRFRDVLANHPETRQSLIDAWKLGNGEVAEKIHGMTDRKLRSQLAALQEEHGERTVHLALVLEGREKVLSKPLPAKSPAKKSAKKTSKKKKTESDDSIITDALQAEIDALQAQQQTIEADLAAVREELSQARKAAHETHLQDESHLHQMARDLKRETARAQSAEKELQEKTREASRSERRAKKLQAELETFELENKRLRRQVRQQQQIAEDLRKQLSTLAPPEPKVLSQPAPEEETRPTPRPRAPLDPADQQFHFELMGRNIQISVRQLAAAIDRSDEDLVYSLTQACFDLRESNPAGHKLFLDRVRAFDRYCARVLTGDTMRVLVDASNVARFEQNKYGKGILDNLLALRDELRSRSYFPIIMIADASLPHFIDQPHEFKRLLHQGILQITNKGEEADEYLARLAQKTGAFVVTNDTKFHLKIAPHFEPLRIGFTIDHGTVYLHEFQ